jgi:M6 family metalloprotease-like protein
MADPVTIAVPKRRFFVGSYAELRVTVDPISGLDFDDLEFSIPDGRRAGLISASRDARFNLKRPTIMLLAGYEPGLWVIRVVHLPTGTDVGKVEFATTDRWRVRKQGPRLWFDGRDARQEAGSAWGGGPAGPQNVNVVPATGTRRIAILMVDTASQRYPAGAAFDAIRDRWINEIINGVTEGGVTRSARAWFQEVSYGNFDISAQIFGPVSLPGPFTDYFNADGSPMGSYYQNCFTAGDSLINYNDFDTLLCVSQNVDATETQPARAAWPYASIGAWGPYTTSDGNVTRGVSSMPANWGAVGDRHAYETFAHELGHNLGLGDQYTPAVAGRNPGGWEMMHADDPLPHFSLAHRMMLGWVPAARVRSFDFQALGGAPVDQSVVLHASEEPPPAGRMSGVEIRLADGLNYYFEYRAGRGGQIGDRALPTDARVLGTDVASAPFVPPFARPQILLLPNDPDGDGPVLDTPQNYRQTDFSTPGFPADFRADVTARTADTATLRIRYGVIGKPDPSIRPWPASPDRPWQSPDIEVRNARNAADPAWFNVPWEGNANTVIAKVKNGGTLDAPGVVVNFFVKNYNIGGAPEVFLGTDTRDVPANATVEFSTGWTPPSQGHFCIIVRIPIYQLPGGAAVEITEFNNVAQSNYDRFISRTASPPSRETTSVEVGNPYDRRTRVFLIGGQSNPLYRTYLETTWLWLEPGETRQVRVMLESRLDPDKPLPDDRDGREIEKFMRLPNDVGLTSFVEDPYDTPRHALWQLGGAQLQVVTGRRTEFIEVDPRANGVSGAVRAIDRRGPVEGGTVLVTLAAGRGKTRRIETLEAKLDGDRFFLQFERFEGKWESMRLYYVPAPGFADCKDGPYRP